MHPLDLSQQGLLPDDILERRDEHLEVARLDLDSGVPSSLRRSLVDYGRDRGRPFLKLECPVGDGGERDNDEVRAVLLLGLDEEGDEGEGLDGFAQTLGGERKKKGVNGDREPIGQGGWDSPFLQRAKKERKKRNRQFERAATRREAKNEPSARIPLSLEKKKGIIMSAPARGKSIAPTSKAKGERRGRRDEPIVVQ